MNSEVPKEVLNETTGCSKHFVCLETGDCGDPEKCGATYAIGTNMLFLPSDEPLAKDCSYRKDFGLYHICTCPTRYVLCQKDTATP